MSDTIQNLNDELKDLTCMLQILAAMSCSIQDPTIKNTYIFHLEEIRKQIAEAGKCIMIEKRRLLN